MERLSPNVWIPGYKKIPMEYGLIKSLTYCGDNKKVTFSCICHPSVNNCEWFHEGKLIVAEQGKHLIKVSESEGRDFYESALVISDPKLEDCGNYMCIMNSENTTDVIDFSLHIKGLELVRAPIIYDIEKPSMDKNSGILTLNFSVHCIEAPESVLWKKRDSSSADVLIIPSDNESSGTATPWLVVIFHSGPNELSDVILLGDLEGSKWMRISNRYAFTIRKESDNIYALKMEIKAAKQSDEGCYTCEVTNKFGEVKQTFFVRLNQSANTPFFLDHPTVDRVFYSDEDFVITAVVKVASPERPTVQWTNPSNKVVSNSSKYMQSVFSYDRTSYLAELVLMDVSLLDHGVWTCEIENSFGKISKQFPINIYTDLKDEEITFLRVCNIPERVKLRNQMFLSFKIMFVCQQPRFEVTWMRYLGQQKIYLRGNRSEPYMIRLRKMTNQAFKAELLYEERHCMEGVFECVIKTRVRSQPVQRSTIFYWNGKTVRRPITDTTSTESEVDNNVVEPQDARKRCSICFTNRGSDESNKLPTSANSVGEPIPSTPQKSPFTDNDRGQGQYPSRSPKHYRGYAQRSRSSIHSSPAIERGTANRRSDPSFRAKKQSATRNMKPPHQ